MLRTTTLSLIGVAGLAIATACAEAPPPPVTAPPTTTLVVRHEERDAVSILDTTRREITATITLGPRVGPVALTVDGQRMFAALPDAIALVDLPAGQVIRTYPLPGDHTALVQGGNVLYVVDDADTGARISALDLTTGAVTTTREIDDLVLAAAITADGRRLFVPHAYYSGRLTILSAPDLRIRQSLTFEDTVRRLALSPDQQTVYVPNGSTFSGRLTIVDASRARTIGDIELPGQPSGVVVHPDGARAYVTLFDDEAVSVINLRDHAVERTVQVREYPSGLAVSADGTAIFVIHNGWLAVSIIDTDTLGVETMPLPAPADDITAPPRFDVR